VINVGIESADYVDVSQNCLDLIPGSQGMLNIQTLIDRGVQVTFEQQK